MYPSTQLSTYWQGPILLIVPITKKTAALIAHDFWCVVIFSNSIKLPNISQRSSQFTKLNYHCKCIGIWINNNAHLTIFWINFFKLALYWFSPKFNYMAFLWSHHEEVPRMTTNVGPNGLDCMWEQIAISVCAAPLPPPHQVLLCVHTWVSSRGT